MLCFVGSEGAAETLHTMHTLWRVVLGGEPLRWRDGDKQCCLGWRWSASPPAHPPACLIASPPARLVTCLPACPSLADAARCACVLAGD